jgi:hypothetical protein
MTKNYWLGGGAAGRGFCCLIAVLAVVNFLPRSAPAQIKSFLSSSVTSESMTHVWVARERGLFKKYGIEMQFILMPRNPWRSQLCSREKLTRRSSVPAILSMPV